MNVDEAWRLFGQDEVFPLEALQWSLDNWDEASPRFLAKLRARARGAEMSLQDLESLSIAIHLFAEKHDARAYAPLCDIIARAPDLREWFFDLVVDTLPGVLMSLFDGEVEPLQRVIASPGADGWVRAAALQALAYAVRAKSALSDEDMRAYLVDLGKSDLDMEVWELAYAWAFSIAALGYDTLQAQVARAFSRHLILEVYEDIKDFHADLALSRRDPDGLATFRDAKAVPFDSTIEMMADWRWGVPEPERDDGSEPIIQPEPDGGFPHVDAPRAHDNTTLPYVTYVNPNRDVGRNDPCPCGSGKKYKKCCLAA